MMAKHAAPLDHGVRFKQAWRQTSMLVRIITSLAVVVVCLIVVILAIGTGARPHLADAPTTGPNGLSGTGSTIVPPGLPLLPGATPSSMPTRSGTATSTSTGAPTRSSTTYPSIPGLPLPTDSNGSTIPVTLPPGITVSTSVGSQPGAPTVIIISSSGGTSTTITQPPQQPPPTRTQPVTHPPTTKSTTSHSHPTPPPPTPSSTPPLIPVGGVLCKLLGLCL